MRDNILFFGCFTVLTAAWLYNGHRRSIADNRYLLHTTKGVIECAYHNSRDLNNGFVKYYTIQGEDRYTKLTSIDSVTVISEDWFTCGPRNEKLKYIESK